MRRRILKAMALLFVLGTVPHSSAAESSQEPSWETSRWTPSLAVGFGLQGQEVSAGTQTNFEVSSTGSTIPLTQIVNLEAELAGPALAERYGGPRPFVDAGVWLPINSVHLVYRDRIVEADPGNTQQDPSILDTEVSRVDTEFRGMLSAGVGIAFSVPVDPVRVLIKPSIEWVGESVAMEGAASKTTEVTTPGMGTQITRDVFVAARDTAFIHGIGPRLSVEVPLGRVGPIGFAPWASVQLYWRLGDRTLEARGSDGADSAVFREELSALAGRGSFGLRLYWLGD